MKTFKQPLSSIDQNLGQHNPDLDVTFSGSISKSLTPEICFSCCFRFSDIIDDVILMMYFRSIN